MLMKWRDRTPPSEIIGGLRAAFIRIRRHDLVFLLDLGVIAGPAETQARSLEKLQEIYERVKHADGKNTMGQSELEKFTKLLSL